MQPDDEDASSIPEVEDPDDAYDGPSIVEMIREIENRLKVTDAGHDADLVALKEHQSMVQDEIIPVFQEMEKKFKAGDKRASRRGVSPPREEGEGGGGGGGAVDGSVLAEIEERIENVEGDLDALSSVAEIKLDNDVFTQYQNEIEHWKLTTEEQLKVASETAIEASDKVLELEENKPKSYDDSGIKRELVEASRGLETRKFDREEAYSLQRELSSEIDTVKASMGKYDILLSALGDVDSVDKEALDMLAAAMKAKMMAMGNAFHKRFEDLEEQLLGVGSSATRSSIGLCLSCSRPTATVEHVDHAMPGATPGAKAPSRPGSRQGSSPAKYYHKAALYSNTFANTEEALLAAAEQDHASMGGLMHQMPQLHSPAPGGGYTSSPSASPMLNGRPSSRSGGLAPLGRPVDQTGAMNRVTDGNSFNLAGIAATSPILDGPFQGRGGLPQSKHVSSMRQQASQGANYR